MYKWLMVDGTYEELIAMLLAVSCSASSVFIILTMCSIYVRCERASERASDMMICCVYLLPYILWMFVCCVR